MNEQLPDGLDWSLLARHFAGECTAEEEAALRRWTDADPLRRDEVERLRALWAEAGALRQPYDAEAALRRIKRTARARAERARSVDLDTPRRVVALHVVPPPASRPVWRRPAGWAAAAAACAALVSGGVLYRGARTPAPVRVPDREYTTAGLQRADLRLPDGTRVRVAPGSRLRVSGAYGAPNRDVELEGEAYFEVTHDPAHPFTVRAGGATARDVGTAFSVRSYAEDGATRVVVREGEVAMSGAGSLGAGDVGRLTSAGRSSVRHGADVDALLGWVDGGVSLAYEDAPLAQVLGDLRRWYGVDARADSALLAEPFTGSLGDMRSRDALAVVAASLGLRIREDGGALVLARPRAAHHAARHSTARAVRP